MRYSQELTLELQRRVAEELLGLRVRTQDATVGADDEYRIGRKLEEGFFEFAGFLSAH